MTSPRSYSRSIRHRLSIILLSPVRSLLLAAAVALNGVFISNGGSPEWAGALSVVPLLAFTGWTIATDYSYRRRDKSHSP
jgi:hypothetical protein